MQLEKRSCFLPQKDGEINSRIVGDCNSQIYKLEGKLEIARNLLGKLAIEEIAIITGLLQHEIEGLKSGI